MFSGGKDFCRLFKLGIAASALAVGLVAMTACQATGPKERGGKTTQLSEWKTVEPYELDLNVPLLISGRITSAENSIRDNALVHNRLKIEGNKGYYSSQRTSVWFGTSTEDTLNDKAAFIRSVKGTLKATLIDHDEPQKINHKKGRAAGYWGIFRVNTSVRKCLFAIAGYRLDPRGKADNDFKNIDTAIYFRYCDPGVTFEQFADLLSNVAIVSDRDALRAALRSLPRAAIATDTSTSRPQSSPSSVPKTTWKGVYCYSPGRQHFYASAWQSCNVVDDIVISEDDYLNEIRSTQKVTTSSNDSAAAVSASRKTASTKRPIAAEWEGYRKLVAGMIEIREFGKNGTLSLELPDNEGRCTGSFRFSDGNQGTWALACTNNLAASGTMESRGKNKGSSGSGTDTQGRTVRFTIAGSGSN